jgi:hypothetical protein
MEPIGLDGGEVGTLSKRTLTCCTVVLGLEFTQPPRIGHIHAAVLRTPLNGMDQMNTFSFQALEFYLKVGYLQAGLAPEYCGIHGLHNRHYVQNLFR